MVDQFASTKRERAARDRFLQDARPYLLEVREVESWPGTGLLGRTVPLWTFTLTAGLVDVLLAQSEGLYDFHTPKLPDDLAVYRLDGSVLLGSVAHEHLGWMNLSAEEKADRRLGLVELRQRAN